MPIAEANGERCLAFGSLALTVLQSGIEVRARSRQIAWTVFRAVLVVMTIHNDCDTLAGIKAGIYSGDRQRSRWLAGTFGLSLERQVTA